jgi:hypothetical protein
MVLVWVWRWKRKKRDWDREGIRKRGVTYRFHPEEQSCGKDIGFNLIGYAPDVLSVLSICGKSEQWASVGGTWLNDQS